MKKILCLILALCCIVSSMLLITSCDKTETPTDPNAQNPGASSEDPDKAFFDAVAASKATEIKTLTYYTYTLASGTEKTYNGTFETSIKSNGDVVFYYTEQMQAKPEHFNNPDFIIDGTTAILKPKTIYYSNGKYSYDNVEWFVEAPTATTNQPKLNLSKDLLGSYEINDAKTSVTATLSPEAAEKLLGMPISAIDDVTVVITTNGSYLTRLTISYENESAKVKVDTSYS